MDVPGLVLGPLALDEHFVSYFDVWVRSVLL